MELREIKTKLGTLVANMGLTKRIAFLFLFSIDGLMPLFLIVSVMYPQHGPGTRSIIIRVGHLCSGMSRSGRALWCQQRLQSVNQSDLTQQSRSG